MRFAFQLGLGAFAFIVFAPVHAFAGACIAHVAVPEPASLGLLAAGVAGLAIAKFRPRK